MGTQKFIKWAIQMVVDYVNEHADATNRPGITAENVYVVWCCKTLGNSKALLSTSVPDGMYYEITYNGAKREAYFDAYKKWENRCIPATEEA